MEYWILKYCIRLFVKMKWCISPDNEMRGKDISKWIIWYWRIAFDLLWRWNEVYHLITKWEVKILENVVFHHGTRDGMSKRWTSGYPIGRDNTLSCFVTLILHCYNIGNNIYLQLLTLKDLFNYRILRVVSSPVYSLVICFIDAHADTIFRSCPGKRYI